MNWTLTDWLTMGGMVSVAGLLLFLATRKARSLSYVAAAALAVGTGFLLVWADLAVGIFGDGGSVPNVLFFGVLGIAVIGAIFARLEAQGMARAMFATAFAQLLLCATGFALGWGNTREVLLASGFALPFIGSAGLFLMAARGKSAATA